MQEELNENTFISKYINDALKYENIFYFVIDEKMIQQHIRGMKIMRRIQNLPTLPWLSITLVDLIVDALKSRIDREKQSIIWNGRI